ncbi:hypothetical protein AYO22_09208 [Fonsecaea multimorphosa]|nr:hypothetical protein AYO22_09208 [Fonsecaea multimorphosa]
MESAAAGLCSFQECLEMSMDEDIDWTGFSSLVPKICICFTSSKSGQLVATIPKSTSELLFQLRGGLEALRAARENNARLSEVDVWLQAEIAALSAPGDVETDNETVAAYELAFVEYVCPPSAAQRICTGSRTNIYFTCEAI